MISFPATVLDGKIRKAFLQPFLNFLPSLDALRLLSEIEMEIQKKKMHSECGNLMIPDSFMIRINSLVYLNNRSSLKTLAHNLTDSIIIFAGGMDWRMPEKPISIEFCHSSSLGKKEVEVMAFFSGEAQSINPLLPDAITVRPVKYPVKSKIIERSGEFVIGRNRDAWLYMNNPYISGRHALIIVSGNGKINVRDVKSQNGTFVNDRPVPSNNNVPVARGDYIRLSQNRGVTLVLK